MAIWRKVKYLKYPTDIAIFYKPTTNTEPTWKNIERYTEKTDTDLKYRHRPLDLGRRISSSTDDDRILMDVRC